MLVENYRTWGTWFLYDCHPQWNSYSKNFILNSRKPSIFPALDIKKLDIVGKTLWRLNIILDICLIYLFFDSILV